MLYIKHICLIDHGNVSFVDTYPRLCLKGHDATSYPDMTYEELSALEPDLQFVDQAAFRQFFTLDETLDTYQLWLKQSLYFDSVHIQLDDLLMAIMNALYCFAHGMRLDAYTQLLKRIAEFIYIDNPGFTLDGLNLPDDYLYRYFKALDAPTGKEAMALLAVLYEEVDVYVAQRDLPLAQKTLSDAYMLSYLHAMDDCTIPSATKREVSDAFVDKLMAHHHFEGYKRKGLAYLEANEREQAKACLMKAWQYADGSDHQLRRMLGDLFYDEGNYERAYDFYSQASLFDENDQAKLRLLTMLKNGLYIKQDPKRYVKLLKELYHAQACTLEDFDMVAGIFADLALMMADACQEGLPGRGKPDALYYYLQARYLYVLRYELLSRDADAALIAEVQRTLQRYPKGLPCSTHRSLSQLVTLIPGCFLELRKEPQDDRWDTYTLSYLPTHECGTLPLFVTDETTRYCRCLKRLTLHAKHKPGSLNASVIFDRMTKDHLFFGHQLVGLWRDYGPFDFMPEEQDVWDFADILCQE